MNKFVFEQIARMVIMEAMDVQLNGIVFVLHFNVRKMQHAKYIKIGQLAFVPKDTAIMR